jgi:hypothetical protein
MDTTHHRLIDQLVKVFRLSNICICVLCATTEAGGCYFCAVTFIFSVNVIHFPHSSKLHIEHMLAHRNRPSQTSVKLFSIELFLDGSFHFY